jgi:DNA-binding transcriptional LysR family regulator
MPSTIRRRGPPVQDLLRDADTRWLSSLLVELRLLRYFVAVADERHFGRAAERLRIAQPSLSRAVQQLERDLGAKLLDRSAAGVSLTAAGTALYDEARTVLDQVEHARARVAAAAGASTLTIGSLAGVVDHAGAALVAAFRARHAGVEVRVRESDFADPSCGLRAGLADVAITMAPFDATGLRLHELRTDPVGVVVRTDDPLARRSEVTDEDLAGRPWFRFPDGTDPVWSAFWTGERTGPVVRTAHECMQAVLWNGSVGLIPLTHELPAGLTAVPLAGHAPCSVVVAWDDAAADPIVRSFVAVAARLRW